MKMMWKALLTFFIPLLFLLDILLIYLTGRNLGFGLFWAILGLTLTFTGLFLWILGFVGLGRHAFAVLPKAKALETKGVYRYFRHPVYLGIALTLVGLSLALGSWPGLIYTIIIILPLNQLRARREEKVLEATFGQAYLEYRKKTII